MKIADIRAPDLFQRLVQRLFVAERGTDFQIVDDSGGDRGNDGYDAVRGILYSIYCPERPETADFRRKARSDLAKARKLMQQPGYHLRDWAFVTPTPIREALQAELRAEAESYGLTAQFISAVHLEDFYLRSEHLRDAFPELEYPRITRELRAIRDALGQPSTDRTGTAPILLIEAGAQPSEIATLHKRDFTGFLSPTLSSLVERLEARDESALADVERYRLEARDDRDYLDALLVELQYFLDVGARARALNLATKGLLRARSSDLHSERAIFAATLAHLKALPLVAAEIDFDMDIESTRVAGVPFTSEEEIASAERTLRELRTEVTSLIDESLDSASASGNLVSALVALQYKASVLAFAYFPLAFRQDLAPSPSIAAQIRNLQVQIESIYERAVQIAVALGSDYRLATTYGNFANDLDTLGERQRAIGHARHAIHLARKSGNATQITKSQLLLAKIARETGQPAPDA